MTFGSYGLDEGGIFPYNAGSGNQVLVLLQLLVGFCCLKGTGFNLFCYAGKGY